MGLGGGHGIAGSFSIAVVVFITLPSLPWGHHYLHSNAEERYHTFFGVLRGVSLGEPMVREDIAIRAVHAGSVLTFSPWEVERHLQHAVEECRIMRSRGNIYFV